MQISAIGTKMPGSSYRQCGAESKTAVDTIKVCNFEMES